MTEVVSIKIGNTGVSIKIGDFVRYEQPKGMWKGPCRVKQVYMDKDFNVRVVLIGNMDEFINVVPIECLRKLEDT